MAMPEKHIDTKAVHSSDYITITDSAVSPAIFLSTTFEREHDGSVGEYLYSRYSNPNRDSFEQAMAELEGGCAGFAFSSGLAAAMAILQTLQYGDHVLIPDDIYYGVASQLQEIFGKFGVSFSRADFTNPEVVERAILPNTKIIWIESPSNPLVKICDIRVIAKIAHNNNAIAVCDNTWATPILQKPLDLGCDVVFHSATKYIGGHSDVLLGVVVVKEINSFSEVLKRIQMVGGAVPSPFECWLASRGLQTLAVRVRAQYESAYRIARHFSTHPFMDKVLYPGLDVHPNSDVAKMQMNLPGAMISMILRSTTEQAMRIASSMKIFTHATSLGAVESLVEHRQSVEPADSQTPGNLLRFSIGLEHADDLIRDIEEAIHSVLSLSTT